MDDGRQMTDEGRVIESFSARLQFMVLIGLQVAEDSGDGHFKACKHP
jgi:hypothetical protein